MPAFMYFLPDSPSPPNLAACRAAGIGYALEREPVPCKVSNVFGRHGYIVGDPDRMDSSRFAYREGLQTWQKWTTPAGVEIHVGMYTDEPPSPGDLQRRKMLDGAYVELADEQQWKVPIARQWHDDENRLIYSPALPQVASLNDDGEWRLNDVLPKYADLWKLSVDYYNAKIQQGMFNIIRGAAQALSGNYVVSEAECSMLGILTLEHARAVLDALVQWEIALDLIQKKIPADGSGAIPGSDSSSGPAAAPETTAQPSST